MHNAGVACSSKIDGSFSRFRGRLVAVDGRCATARNILFKMFHRIQIGHVVLLRHPHEQLMQLRYTPLQKQKPWRLRQPQQQHHRDRNISRRSDPHPPPRHPADKPRHRDKKRRSHRPAAPQHRLDYRAPLGDRELHEEHRDGVERRAREDAGERAKGYQDGVVGREKGRERRREHGHDTEKNNRSPSDSIRRTRQRREPDEIPREKRGRHKVLLRP
mmetsp:Transcript_2588/g.6863  ORF Transcript_2588/g.6863 Transcript_2588/m.6863 type:complete len:217 (+) Transcript_2588:1302-1952(+)